MNLLDAAVGKGRNVSLKVDGNSISLPPAKEEGDRRRLCWKDSYTLVSVGGYAFREVY